MDFQSLPRKELQALCKQHRIPANMTNVAMADALQALLAIRDKEGVAQETLENQSAKKSVASASAPLRFSRRASARRQAEAAAPSSVEPNEHPASPLPRARRVTARTSEIRRLVSEDEEDQIKEEVSVESTPITSTVKYATRRTRKEEAADVKKSRTTATRKGRRTTARRGAETPDVVVQETEDMRMEENADANGGTVEGSKTTSMRMGRRMAARRGAGAESPVVREQEKEHTLVSSKVSARRMRQSSKAIAVDVTTTATRRSTRARARASISVMQALAPGAEQLQKDFDIKDPGERDNDSISLSCDESLDLGTVDADDSCGKDCNLDVDAKMNEQQLLIVVEEDGVDVLEAEEFAEVKQLESLAQVKHDEEQEKWDAECPKHQIALEVEEDEIAAPTADAGAEELVILVQEKEVVDVEEFKKVAQEKEEEMEKGGIVELAVDVEDALATQEVEAGVEELETLAREKEELEKGDIIKFSVDEEDAIVIQEVEAGVEELETLAHEKEEELEKGEIVELAAYEEDAIVTQEVEAGVEELEILVQEEVSEKVGMVGFAIDEENAVTTQVDAGAEELEILVKEKEEKLEKGEIVELAIDEEDAIATQEVEAGVEELEILVQEEESEKVDMVKLAINEENALATQVEAGAEFEILVKEKEELEIGDIVELAVDEEVAIATQEVEASVEESEILVQDKDEELEKEESNKLAVDEVAEFGNVEELDNVSNEKEAELEKRDTDQLEILVQQQQQQDDDEEEEEELEKGENNELPIDEVASPEVEQVAGVGDLAIATQQVSMKRGENGVDSLFPSEKSLDLAGEEADDNCEQECNLKVHDDKIHQPKLAMEVEGDESGSTEAEEFAELKELEIVAQEEEQMEKDGKSQKGKKEHNEYPGLQEESPIVGLISSLQNLTIDAGEDKEMRLDPLREYTIPSETNNFSTLNQAVDDDKTMEFPAKITGEARDANVISEANKENEIGVENDAKKQGVECNQMSLIKLKKLYKQQMISMNNNKVEVTRLALTEITGNNKS